MILNRKSGNQLKKIPTIYNFNNPNIRGNTIKSPKKMKLKNVIQKRLKTYFF